jgi:hypothetical protein
MNGRQIVRMATAQWGYESLQRFVDFHGPQRAANLLYNIFYKYEKQLTAQRMAYKTRPVIVSATKTKPWPYSPRVKIKCHDENLNENRIVQLGSACRHLPSTSKQQINFAVDKNNR